MSPPQSNRTYDLGFARWVRDNVDGGDRMNMCMQCGVCSGSCPVGDQMDNGPRKTFMMIRAGMKEAVLTSDTIWNCVSCYNCVVRCPRQVPVTYILHELCTLAVEEGYVNPKDVENVRFAKAFWWSAQKYGKTDERLVTAKFYFSGGIGDGIKKGMAQKDTAMAMIKKGRLHLGMPYKVKNRGGLQKILAKAKEIEAAKQGA